MRRLRSLPRRLAAALLPEPQLRVLRTLWHRSQALDPRRLWLRRAFRRLNEGAAPDVLGLRRVGYRLTATPGVWNVPTPTMTP